MATSEKEHLGRAKSILFGSIALVALGVLALLIVRDLSLGGRAPVASVLVFAVFLVWATNFQVALSQDLFVSPDLMVVMAAIAAFHGRGGVLSAALIGLSGGLVWRVVTNPSRTLGGNLLVTAFNCGQFLLAATAAALAYEFVAGPGEPHILAGVALAAVAYAAVNMALMLGCLAVAGTRVQDAWVDMAPALPNFFAFGVVGALVGQLYAELGLMSLVVLVVPSLIARRTFRSTLVLREARGETIAVFLKALEVKDLYTARHTERVAKYAGYIGEELGFRPNRLTDLRHAALMHDIGKLAVSSKLLNKPGKLTEAEYQDVRRHNEVCVEILTQVEFLRSSIPVATDRHGTFNAGEGKADASTLHGYIVSVADAFDAMTSTRAYRKALSQDVAFEELCKGKGTQFHPASVDALIAAIERRGETFGAGYEVDLVDFEFEPPTVGVGSAGLGDLEGGRQTVAADPFGDLQWPRRGRG
jgi:HD superfamily phosphohydrolase YqeK/heme exporter protein D